MKDLTYEQKEAILDSFGKLVIENVRDGNLRYSMKIANYTTINPVQLKQYSALSSLSHEQQEAVCDLLSETITGVIYDFLEMVEENQDKIELSIYKDGEKYNMCHISEKMGSEIARFEDSGWIQKFSEIGRFVL
jgi:hypothetical protein